ncbi:MAG: SIR2 family protein [Methanobacterium sp.]
MAHYAKSEFEELESEIKNAIQKNKEFGELLRNDISKKKRICFFEIWKTLDHDTQYAILRRHLWENKNPSEGYKYLVQLIERNFIKTVFSTNLDYLLEKSLSIKGFYQPDNFVVIVNGKDRPDEITEQLNSSRVPLKILKLHGSLESPKSYAFRPEEIFDFERKIKPDLSRFINQSLIVVGYSGQDRDVHVLFEKEGKEIYFVKPTIPETESEISQILSVRGKGKIINGNDGNFDIFFRKLVEYTEELESNYSLGSEQLENKFSSSVLTEMNASKTSSTNNGPGSEPTQVLPHQTVQEFKEKTIVKSEINSIGDSFLAIDHRLETINRNLEAINYFLETSPKRSNAYFKTNITAVGLTGSGKTCYLIGMYCQALAESTSFTLSTDKDSDRFLEYQWMSMCDSSLGRNRFPECTDEISKYDFKLKSNYEEIMSFEWIEYPGGLLKYSTKKSEMTANIMSDLKRSSCLLLFIDGEIFGKKIDDPYTKLIQNGARTYTKFLNIFEDENHFIPPVVIVITKYDICDESRSSEDIIMCIQEGFPVLFSPNDLGYKKLASIIPITLGKNITKNDYQGEIDPRNIHLPIAFSILCALISRFESLKSKNNEINTQITKNSSNFLQRLANKSEIEKMRRSVEANNSILNKLSENAVKLQNELVQRSIPTYLNGNKVDSKNLLREYILQNG